MKTISVLGAGLPFIVINTLLGSLTTYGLSGLRYEGSAIVLFAIVLVLQSLVAIQLMTFCVWVTPNQVWLAHLTTMHKHLTIANNVACAAAIASLRRRRPSVMASSASLGVCDSFWLAQESRHGAVYIGGRMNQLAVYRSPLTSCVCMTLL